MKIQNKTLLATLAIVTTATLSGCNNSEETHVPQNTPEPTLTAEEQEVLNEYTKPTTKPSGEVVEAKDPLVELLGN